MTTDTALAAACGIYCGDCSYLGEKCEGCNQLQGKPFWTAQYGMPACPLYDCSVNQKQMEHCGLCADFPCETFTSLRDPSMSDEEAAQSQQQRQKDLRRRKEIGTAAWLAER